MKRIIATLLLLASSLFSLASAQEIPDCRIATCEICNERFDQDMARNRILTFAGVTAEFPTTDMTAKDFRDYDPNAGATYDATETGTVPATPYQVETKWKPLRNFGVTVTVGGNARTLVRLGTEASGQVGVDFSQGLFSFHSSDAAGSYSIAYRGVGAVVSATDLNILQANMIAEQVYVRTAVVGPASATDNAAARFNLTTGKLVQDSLLIIADNGNTSTVGTLTGSNISGTNSGDVSLNSAANSILSLSTQEIGLDTQTANYVWAGPTSGGAATPTFRALVNGDLAQINEVPQGWTFNAATLGNSPFIASNLWAVSNGDYVKVGVFSTGVEADSGSDTNDWQVLAVANSTSNAYDFRLAATSGGTMVTTATSPLSINTATGNLTLSTVPIANGGTNSTATPTAGGIAYGTGTAYAFTSAITADAVVKGNGASAPAASTTLFAGSTPKAVSSVDVWMSAVADGVPAVGNTWEPDDTRLYDTTGGNSVFFGLSSRLRPGTIISHVLVTYGVGANGDDFVNHVMQRRDASSAASAWADLYTEQNLTTASSPALSTYSIPSPITIAAGYVYRIKVTTTVGATSASLYDVGVRTTERAL